MNRLRRRIERQELEAEQKALLDAAESGVNRLARGRSAEGDERRLRGIPAIARGVPGEIPGTHPEKTATRRRNRRARVRSA